MLEHQSLQPYQDYHSEIRSAKVYYIYDHLAFGEGVQDTLKLALEENGIEREGKFFIFDSYQHLEGYQGSSVYTHEFLLATIHDYLREFRSYEIDFATKQVSFNCQMNKSRYPRALASCWLKNNLYGKAGFIYSQPWDMTGLGSFLDREIRKHKFKLEVDLLPVKWFDHDGEDPKNYLANTTNERVFRKCLKSQMFDPCVFSLVLEPIEYELGATITEKYVNAVYGGNIPIVYGYKVYDVLSTIGFDTFADIIDTTSQDIVDPQARVIAMLESNKHVLTSGMDLINDTALQERLNHNLALMRNPEKMREGLSRLNDPICLETYRNLIACDPKLRGLSFYFNH